MIEIMDAVGEDEPDPIRLKSIKNNKTFTVPQNDRVSTVCVPGVGRTSPITYSDVSDKKQKET